MNALLILSFVFGAFIGIVVLSCRKPQRAKRFVQNDQLDTVDEMFLHGAVNNDEFYRM